MAPWQVFGLGLAAGAAGAAGLLALGDRWRGRRLGRFFAHAAHEINTPITAINITNLNFLSGVFGEVPPDQLKWMDMMRDQVARLSGMVGELRDLIHMLLSRDLNLQTESVVLDGLVEEALALIRRGAAQSQIEIKVELPADLPRVRVDRDRTIRTLASLLFHARKFRAEGDLRLTGGRRGRAVALVLEYQGRPLPPGEARRSLELLYPAHGRSGHTLNSVGLGLGVQRAVARRQGGDLEFQVGPDGRSTLTLILGMA